MTMHIDYNGFATTVIAFSGLAPRNYLYEWTKSFNDLEVNFIGIRDEHNCWYQMNALKLFNEIKNQLERISFSKLVCIGGSAGGFAALWFGFLLRADRVIAFCPQSACGEAKRKLGDLRWPEFCDNTPSGDIAKFNHNRAEIHYAQDCELDILHAERLWGEHVCWPEGGHDLPHLLKARGQLKDIFVQGIRL